MTVSRARFLGAAVTLTLVALVAFLSVSPWLVALFAGVPWIVTWRHRVGADGIVAIVFGSALAVVTVTLSVAGSLHGFAAEIDSSVSIMLAVAFGAAGVAGWLTLNPASRDAKYPLPPYWWGAAVGPVIWAAAFCINLIQPIAERVNWVMRNDIGNTLIFAHDIIREGGILVGPMENPAPLPAALLASAIDPGRSGVAAADLIAHDLLVTSVLWAVLIGISAFLAGVTSGAVAKATGASPRWQRVAGSLGSLIVLSWFFTGYPLEYGFLNAHLLFVVLCSSFLIYLSAERHAVLALTALMGFSAVTLAVWSPTVLIPAALFFAVMVRNWSAVRSIRGRSLVAFIIMAILGVAAVAVFAVPPLLAQREALSGNGGIYNPGSWLIFVLVAFALIASAVSTRSVRTALFAGVAAVAVGTVSGLAVLLFVSRRSPDIWTYYPVKFGWMVGLVIIIIVLGATVGVIAQRIRARSARVFAVSVVAALVAWVVVWTPVLSPTHISLNPVVRLVAPQLDASYLRTTRAVLELADPTKPVVLWESSLRSEDGRDAEGVANIWLLQWYVDSLVNQPDLRLLAYLTYDDRSPRALCSIAAITAVDLQVYTGDPALEATVREECPDAGIQFYDESDLAFDR